MCIRDRGYAPDQTVAYGENVSLPMDGFSKEGKTFIGWSLTANDIGSTVQSLRSGFSYVNMYKTETKYFDSPQDVTPVSYTHLMATIIFCIP